MEKIGTGIFVFGMVSIYLGVKRIKDGRYKGGFRKEPITWGSLVSGWVLMIIGLWLGGYLD